MAVEEDVNTNRFTLGSFAADLSIPLTPARTSGMTLFGSESKERLDAT
jgi:hypothetical protein